MLSVKINEDNYTFCWGTLAFRRTCDELGIELSDLDIGLLSGNDLYWHKLSYNALIVHELTFNNGIRLVGDQFESFNFYQYVYWIDNEAGEGMNSKISDSYKNSKYLGKTMQAWYDELAERINSMNDEPEKKEIKKKKERSLK